MEGDAEHMRWVSAHKTNDQLLRRLLGGKWVWHVGNDTRNPDAYQCTLMKMANYDGMDADLIEFRDRLGDSDLKNAMNNLRYTRVERGLEDMEALQWQFSMSKQPSEQAKQKKSPSLADAFIVLKSQVELDASTIPEHEHEALKRRLDPEGKVTWVAREQQKTPWEKAIKDQAKMLEEDAAVPKKRHAKTSPAPQTRGKFAPDLNATQMIHWLEAELKAFMLRRWKVSITPVYAHSRYKKPNNYKYELRSIESVIGDSIDKNKFFDYAFFRDIQQGLKSATPEETKRSAELNAYAKALKRTPEGGVKIEGIVTINALLDIGKLSVPEVEVEFVETKEMAAHEQKWTNEMKGQAAGKISFGKNNSGQLRIETSSGQEKSLKPPSIWADDPAIGSTLSKKKGGKYGKQKGQSLLWSDALAPRPEDPRERSR